MANLPIPPDIAERRLGKLTPGRGGAGGNFSGGGVVPPSPPSGPGGVGGASVVISPPTVERPPEATDFNMDGTLTGRTAVNTPTIFPGPTATLRGAFQVPSNNVAVIRSFALLANQLLVTSNIVWTLLYNEIAVPGWDRLTINPRAASSVELTWGPFETYIPVPEGALIQWSVQVFDVATYQLSVQAHGWYYPTRIAGNFTGLYG